MTPDMPPVLTKFSVSVIIGCNSIGNYTEIKYLTRKVFVMHNGNRGIFSMIESYIDMLINTFSIIVGYVFVLLIDEQKIILADPKTIVVIFVDVLLLSFCGHAFGLYKPNRYTRTFRSFPAVFETNAVFFGTMAIVTAFIARPGYKEFVLLWILFTAFSSTAILTFKRHGIKSVMKLLFKKNFHLRKVIIIGDNTQTAADYVKQVNSNGEYGIMILGYVGDKIDQNALGVDKLGSFFELADILDKYRPTDVVFAIDAYDKRRLIKLVNMCDDRCIKVYFLPVIYGFFKTSRQIEQVGTVPVINIHSTPLDNTANAIIKRAIDIVGSLILIVLTSPIMLITAIGVYLSSPGPILFKQTRVGRLGKKFTMLKFRSMKVNSESNKGWTTGNDPRKTKFGTFIRKTAIDELPQFFNVLAGQMSLVGPRPEIPYYVEHFKEIVPLYMVKHYVKPGVTGLAQIKGLRGDTSIEDRIHEDINYIENWSLMLDLYILFKTPFKALNKNEKYVKEEKDADPCEENQQISSPEQNTAEKDATAENNVGKASDADKIRDTEKDGKKNE